MSDWLDAKAEELLEDPIVPVDVKNVAAAYQSVSKRLSEVSSCDTTRKQEQAEQEKKDLNDAYDAGWRDHPAPDTIVKVVAEKSRYVGKLGRVRGYLTDPGWASVELVDHPVLACFRLADLRSVGEETVEVRNDNGPAYPPDYDENGEPIV
jgi:hypothetical protein